MILAASDKVSALGYVHVWLLAVLPVTAAVPQAAANQAVVALRHVSLPAVALQLVSQAADALLTAVVSLPVVVLLLAASLAAASQAFAIALPLAVLPAKLRSAAVLLAAASQAAVALLLASQAADVLPLAVAATE